MLPERAETAADTVSDPGLEGWGYVSEEGLLH